MRFEWKNYDEFRAKFDARKLAYEPLKKAVTTAAILVQGEARNLAPSDTGQLRRAIQFEFVDQWPILTGRVGGNLRYACLFGPNARIITKDGYKRVGDLRTGDLVLTQTGDNRRVIAITSFPATAKPNLVDIEIKWRHNKTHKLTVTTDHKILALRDGRNKWIQAGDLLTTDRLYSRKKINHRKGTGRTSICKNCWALISGGGNCWKQRSFCSIPCRTEYWANGYNPHLGRKRSDETKHRLRAIVRERYSRHPELHPNRLLAKRGKRTAHELEVETWLRERRLSFETQRPVGPHFVDFFVGSENTIFEADGAYWHRDQSRDIQRDTEILVELPGVKIVHLHFYDPRFSPELDASPLPNVHYVAVNPSPKSYAEPSIFDAKEIVSLRHWRYEPSGSRVASLYDLSVEGIHSFIANGIVVSNSYMESGTGLMNDGGIPGGSGKRHWPPGHALDAWATRHGFESGAQVARIIGRRGGIPPSGARLRRPFLRTALKNQEERIRAVYDAAQREIQQNWDAK